MEPFSLEDFLNRVRQADAWAQMRARQRNVSLENWGDRSIRNWAVLLRSFELAPSQSLLVYDNSSERNDANEDFSKACQGVLQRRAELLNLHGLAAGGKPVEGRLLVYSPWNTLSDGPSESETAGFFDVEDWPPWDIWIHSVIHSDEKYSWFELFCWVPAPLIALVEAGIDVCASGCMNWVSEWDSSFAQTLRDAGLGGHITL